MTTPFRFDPPGNINDFPESESNATKLRLLWNDYLTAFTRQTLQNDPWGQTNQPALNQYFDPTETVVPDGAAKAAITWTAFPKRLQTAYPSSRDNRRYADDGPPDPHYRPGLPRGWQDEYCEWSVTRNSEGKIVQVDFTCENREYWYALWQIDRNRVLELYQELVGSHVQLEDLYLRDAQGRPIQDPLTGMEFYDPHNRYNRDTVNGAVHLVSSPNALSAEIFLAGQATILRHNADGSPKTSDDDLIQCSHYGNPGRNSDPHIGAAVNNTVRGGTPVRVSLSNPVGLYIQSPDFGAFRLPPGAPAGAHPSDYWRVVRGHAKDASDTDPAAIDRILHAVYEVPAGQGFTVSDITIDGTPIRYGSQITEHFRIGLQAVALPQVEPAIDLRCAAERTAPQEAGGVSQSDAAPPAYPRPYVMAPAGTMSNALQTGFPMRMGTGLTLSNVELYCADTEPGARVVVSGGDGVTMEVTGSERPVGDPDSLILKLTVTVSDGAELGFRSVQVINQPDTGHGPAFYGVLQVIVGPHRVPLHGGSAVAPVPSMGMIHANRNAVRRR